MSDVTKCDLQLSSMSRETTWSNNVHILTATKSNEARGLYLLMATKYRYSPRELDRQITSVLFKRPCTPMRRTA